MGGDVMREMLGRSSEARGDVSGDIERWVSGSSWYGAKFAMV